MTIYHCIAIGKPEDTHFESDLVRIDMENVDYKRQPCIDSIDQCITENGGKLCGVLRGGMFGFATNQVWALSVWNNSNDIQRYVCALENTHGYQIDSDERLAATVRPTTIHPIDRPGIYVVRWIRIQSSDVVEYTKLCLETWPRFEANSHARCYGVFRQNNNEGVEKILMLTWYATLSDWEQSRQLDPTDKQKWARRSEMELSHWAQAGRLA